MKKVYYVVLILTFSIGSVASAMTNTPVPAAHSIPSQPDSRHPATNHSKPYEGYQDRSIRALSTEEIENFQMGKGAGYALAAELNHYPGPKHVLELAKELELTAEQVQIAKEQERLMQEKAIGIGKQIIALEKQLDDAFRSKTITESQLHSLTQQIAEADGRYRYVHLQAHLVMKKVMTEKQIARYDQLRGYRTE
ncbi:MAG TPA: hypothetical protein VE710_10415 [Candidatus Bathyarchaeia archaeon]|nr:hypothetical protein [Candidatus Bathyarchaeia archaeon]